MKIQWQLLVFGFAFAFLIESLVYLLFPHFLKEAAKFISSAETKIIRYIGVVGFFVAIVLFIIFKVVK